MKIRIGNDFVFNWAIERGGLPEDLSSVLEKHLHLSVFGKRVELIEGVDYDISGNVIRIEVTPAIANIIGTYKAEFKYILPDIGFIDDDRKCAVDVDAFQIVAKTAQADDSTEFSMTSDMAIAFKGDKGDSAYEVWLKDNPGKTKEDYFNWLQKPATDIAETVNLQEQARVEAENERDSAETSRIQSESERLSAETIRQSNEDNRIENEATRVQNEAERISKEGIRQSNETDRVEAEGIRQNNEIDRIEAEEVREQAESERLQAESKREQAETARVNAEGDATKGRVKAENERVQAESERAQAFSQMMGEADAKIEEMDETLSTYEGRVTQVESDISQLAGDVKQKSVIPNIPGYIGSNGAIGGSSSYLVTNFERYISGDIVVSGYQAASAYLLFFYDKYFQPISPYTTTTGKKTNIIITQSEIPIGTAFVRSQSREQDNNGLLILKRDVSYYVPSNEEYIDSLLMENELDGTTSVPYFNGEILEKVEYIGLNNRVVRSDIFVFTDTHITETRTMQNVSKIISFEKETLKTTIL